MNALEDPEMIKLLYRASQAGIRVDLQVRGLCCLRPGVAGVSKKQYTVKSVIGRFSNVRARIYYFRNGGRPRRGCRPTSSSRCWARAG